MLNTSKFSLKCYKFFLQNNKSKFTREKMYQLNSNILLNLYLISVVLLPYSPNAETTCSSGQQQVLWSLDKSSYDLYEETILSKNCFKLKIIKNI